MAITLNWFLLFVILLLVEIITVNLVSIWFSIGALFSCVVSLFIDNLYIQILIFIIVSIVSLLLTKPIVKKLRIRNIEKTNLDSVIDKIGVVTQNITSVDAGEIKIMGKKWTAISNENLFVGDRVKVLNISGVKLIVKKYEEV